MRSKMLMVLALTLVFGSPAAAETLGLAWGVVAEPATAGDLTPNQVAEHLEFLQAHGWQAVRAGDAGTGSEKPVVLSFGDPASALRYVVPLLTLYKMPAVVTVGPAQAADPAMAPVLKDLAASPWVELVPRVEEEAGAEDPVRCGDTAVPAGRQEERLSRLALTLAAQVARLRELTGTAPATLAWAPGTWSGSAEAVAGSLGLKVQLPAFTDMPPSLDPPRVALYEVPSWAGVWALSQASVHWDPRDHPVRFVEVEAAWVCAGGDPQARIARIVQVVRRLGLNGVRILPGGAGGAWFETAAAPVRGDVVGPLAHALREAGVRWVMADLPAASGDPGRDVALATDLARAADLDVAVLPATAVPTGRLGEAVNYVRPAARLAWRPEGREGDRAFHLAPPAPGQADSRGLTVGAHNVATADAEAARFAVAGWEWIGLPMELAEAGLKISLRSLAAFALPSTLSR